MTLNINAKPGDETRRNGDYVGLPHSEGEVRLSEVDVPKGTPVKYDGSNIAKVTGDGSDTVVGVVSEYDVFGGNQGKLNEQLVKGDRDATVKTHGAVVADLTVYADNGATVSEGSTLGSNGEILVLEEVDGSADAESPYDYTNAYEVLIR